MDGNDSLSRRQFVAGAGAAAAGPLLGPSARGQPSEVTMLAGSPEALRQVCRGAVIGAGEPEFAERVYGGLWNRLVPERAPQIVVCAADEQDVISSIQFAREKKLKVVVRGGGHNWCQPTLRNGGFAHRFERS